jgi:hypothetical protein
MSALTQKKEAQQTTADMVHAAFWSFFDRKSVKIKMVNFINFCAKFAARQHSCKPLININLHTKSSPPAVIFLLFKILLTSHIVAQRSICQVDNIQKDINCFSYLIVGGKIQSKGFIIINIQSGIITQR